MFVYLYNKSILLVHTYDLLQDRCTDCVNITNISLLFFLKQKNVLGKGLGKVKSCRGYGQPQEARMKKPLLFRKRL